MTPGENDILENEQLRGNQAQHAYDNFIGPFIEEKRQVLFEAFQTTQVNEVEQLKELKRVLSTLNALEIEITTIIETGKMASMTMEQTEKH